MTEYRAGASPQPPPEQREGTFQQGREAAREVAGTARQQTGAVAGEAREQAQHAVEQIREQAREQARQQSERAAQGIRHWADELSSMNDAAKPDSQVAGVVRQVADGGRRAADYLEQNGFAGVVGDVQDFARRRPAVFLAGALAAGFLVGRIAKASTGPEPDGRRSPDPAPSAFTDPAYPAGSYTDPDPRPEPDAGLTGQQTRPVPAPGAEFPPPPGSEFPPTPGAAGPPPPGRAGDLP